MTKPINYHCSVFTTILLLLVPYFYSVNALAIEDNAESAIAIKGENYDENNILIIYATDYYIHLMLSNLNSPTKIIASTSAFSMASTKTYGLTGNLKKIHTPQSFIKKKLPELIKKLDRPVTATKPLKVRYVSAFVKGYDDYAQEKLCEVSMGGLNLIKYVDEKIQERSGEVGYGHCKTDENGNAADTFTRGDYFIKKLKEHLGNHFVNFEFEPHLIDEKNLLTLAARVDTQNWNILKNVNVVFTGANAEGVQIRNGVTVRNITPGIPSDGGFYHLGKMVYGIYAKQLEPAPRGIHSFDNQLLRGLSHHPIYIWNQQQMIKQTNEHLFSDWGSKKRFIHIGALSTEVAQGNIKPVPRWDEIYSQYEAKEIVRNILYGIANSPFDVVAELLGFLSESTDYDDDAASFSPVTRVMGTFPWSNLYLSSELHERYQNTEVVTMHKFAEMLNYAGYTLTTDYASQDKAVRIQRPDQTTLNYFLKFVPFLGSQY